jgi:hypothetical protein
MAGEEPRPGARPAVEALSFGDYARIFAGRHIRWGWREDRPGSLYERGLGEAFDTLPPQLRALHRPGAGSRWAGRAEVERGRGPVAAVVARIFGFPAEGADCPVEVEFRVDAEGRETWDRRFAGRLMRSVQEEGRGRNAGLVVERFGPLAFGLALVRDGGRLLILARRWSLGACPCPGADAAGQRVRGGAGRTLPLPCGDRPTPPGPGRALPGLARARPVRRHQWLPGLWN